MLSRDDILGAKDIKTVEVEVPEWGGSVLIGMMTGAGRDKFETDMLTDKGRVNVRAKLAALTLVDEEGNHLFKYDEAEELGNKSAAALSRVFDEACKLNRITSDDVADLEGN